MRTCYRISFELGGVGREFATLADAREEQRLVLCRESGDCQGVKIVAVEYHDGVGYGYERGLTEEEEGAGTYEPSTVQLSISVIINDLDRGDS